MKRPIIIVFTFLFAWSHTYGQDKKATDTAKNSKHRYYFSVSSDGVNLGDTAKKNKVQKSGTFSIHYVMMDLGVNLIQDKTNYSSPAVQNYLQVPGEARNSSLFNLRTSKSINVNLYPVMFKFLALKTAHQQIYISTGLGLQLYNFRYKEPITYTRNPATIIIATNSFKKDKLGLDYLNVPLMLTFKTKLHKTSWLVYGTGITEGYRIASWTKQESKEYGKVKVHDPFNFADFNTCLSAEIGLDGSFRFYASYQLTSLYNNGLDQHPFCIGIRFDGI